MIDKKSMWKKYAKGLSVMEADDACVGGAFYGGIISSMDEVEKAFDLEFNMMNYDCSEDAYDHINRIRKRLGLKPRWLEVTK